MYRVDVYLRVRRAIMVEGESIREASRVFGLHRGTVRKVVAYSVPPGYRRHSPPRRPKLDSFTGVIDRILEDDLGVSKKQRHTAKRIFERLRDEYGFGGQYTIVKDYVREHRRQSREMFVPLSHSPGHAQCDFGEARVGGSRPVKWCKSASSCCCCLGGSGLREIGLWKSFVEGQHDRCDVSTANGPFVVLLSQYGANEAAHGRPVREGRYPPHRCVAGSPC